MGAAGRGGDAVTGVVAGTAEYISGGVQLGKGVQATFARCTAGAPWGLGSVLKALASA